MSWDYLDSMKETNPGQVIDARKAFADRRAQVEKLRDQAKTDQVIAEMQELLDFSSYIKEQTDWVDTLNMALAEDEYKLSAMSEGTVEELANMMEQIVLGFAEDYVKNFAGKEYLDDYLPISDLLGAYLSKTLHSEVEQINKKLESNGKITIHGDQVRGIAKELHHTIMHHWGEFTK